MNTVKQTSLEIINKKIVVIHQEKKGKQECVEMIQDLSSQIKMLASRKRPYTQYNNEKISDDDDDDEQIEPTPKKIKRNNYYG